MSEEQELLQSLTGLRDQILDQLRDYWMLSVPYSLGEVAIVAAFAKAFKQQHGGALILLVDPAKFGVVKLFSDDTDGALQIPMGVLRGLRTRGLIGPEVFRPGTIHDVYHLNDAKLNLISLIDLRNQKPDRGLSNLDALRFSMRLPWEAKLSRGRPGPEAIQAAQEIAARVGMEPGNSVILFPGNNTNQPAPSEFWKQVATKARESGRKVFVNISGAAFLPPDLDIPGAAIELDDIPSAIATCAIAGRIVSGANGFVMTSLLTETDFGLDVILTDAYDPVGTGVFQSLPIHSGSLRINAPDLLEDLTRPYREWAITSATDLEDTAVQMTSAWA